MLEEMKNGMEDNSRQGNKGNQESKDVQKIKDAQELNETQETKAGQPATAAKEIRDIKEKKLVIARYFIKLGNNGKKFGERDIFRMWNNYFPDDFRVGSGKRLKLQKRKGYLTLALPNCKGVPEGMVKTYANLWRRSKSWVFIYAHAHTLEECDKDLGKLRREQERALKSACKYIGYGAKLCRQPKSRLAEYRIFTKGLCIGGSFSNVMEEVGENPKGAKEIMSPCFTDIRMIDPNWQGNVTQPEFVK